MRSRLVLTLVVVAVLATAAFAAVTAKPVQSFPSKAQACTVCHPAAPSSAAVKATPSVATPAPGATYTLTIAMTGFTAGGDTGYWIANGAGAPALSVYAGATGTNQTTYTRTMTAPSSPGSYTYTVWADKGDKSSGQAKSTTYSITVQAPPAPAPAITTLSPNHGLTGASVVIAGSNLGTGGVVKFGGTTATTTAWSATSVTAKVPTSLAPGSVNVAVTPSGATASNALAFTVDAPPTPTPTAAITTLNPNHGLTGASVVIAGSNLGTSGVVKFGGTTATTTAWSATSVTAKVPTSLAPGSVNVTVTPSGATASNALAFTVDAPPSTGDTTAPVSTAGGVRADRWYNHTLRIRLSATDELNGSGVGSITYSIDGGAPVTVLGSTAAVTLTVDAKMHATDGPHTITYHATDVAGNVETAHTLTVNIDTVKPHAKTPSTAKVRRYRMATLAYEVDDVDPNGGTARVTILVKNRRGDVVKRLRLGTKPVDMALSASFRCKLRAGTYTFSVTAIDEAGNRQAAIATRTLRVY